MDDHIGHTSVYQNFIAFIRNGFAALDGNTQAEVKQFITSCQHANGAFTDRAGNPDYYYSLFGTWLSVALGLEEVLKKHHQFIFQFDNERDNQIDEFAALLIKIAFPGNSYKMPSLMHLLNKTFLKSSQVSFFYRIFLFFLVFDALYSNRTVYFLARWMLVFTSPPADSPASFHAAYTIARYKSGGAVSRQQRKLFLFFEEGKGFKAFMDADEADLLSTAVALYALKVTGTDLRKVAPSCLEFIEKNYKEGAFLAGNGDEMRDLEYTFYGLLALGILV